MRNSLFLVVLLFLVKSYSHEGCFKELIPAGRETKNPQVSIIESGNNDQGNVAFYEKVIQELTEEGGIYDKLGLARMNQVIEFMPGNDLDSLLGANGYPVSHWIDGAQIVATKRNPSGLVYEFVVPGSDVRHSFYRDDLPIEKQLSIILHVGGHNHFSVHTRWAQVRTIDMVPGTHQMYELMESLYGTVHPDEVAKWYQYLSSLMWAQDIPRGVMEVPEEFQPHEATEKEWRSGKVKKVPLSSTPNILQVFIANLPTNLPKWKVEMARLFERLNRYIPGAVRTKIMNEGWATLMQELVLPHTSFDSLSHRIQKGELMGGVTYKSLSNPYWLGLEAWRRLRENFNNRAENEGLEPIELDRKFVEYANKEIMGVMDDEEFLRTALDDQWIARENLYLGRKAKNQWDPSIGPPPKDMKQPEQWEVVTRDPHRIRESVITKVASKESFPRVVVRDLKNEFGYIELGFDRNDSIGNSIPLEAKSMVQTLYIYSQIMSQPVSIDTVYTKKTEISWEEMPDDWDIAFSGPWWESPRGPSYKYKDIKVRVTVTGNGIVKVYEITEEGEVIRSDGDDDYELELQEKLNEFIEELNVGEDNSSVETMDLISASTAKGLKQDSADAVNSAPIGLQMHAPTVPRALSEYRRMVQKRLLEILEKSLKNGGITRTKKGVRLKVLPSVPSFRFDSKEIQRRLEDQPVPEVDRLAILNMAEVKETRLSNPYEHEMERAKELLNKGEELSEREKYALEWLSKSIAQSKSGAFNPDDPLDIGSGGGTPGKKYWKDGNPNGNGKGKGNGEPGDEPGGDDAGQGGMDPSYVDIPFDRYSSILGENIELPNLNPKAGGIRSKSEEPDGEVYNRMGRKVMPTIGKRAYGLGLYTDEAEDSVDGGEEDEEDPADIILRGLEIIRPSDIVVESFSKTKEPDINAQVTIAMDLSGSMIPYYAVAKKVIYDLKALLAANYPKLVFRFVVFDSEAHAYEDEDEFFRAKLGGGTNYKAGFEKVLEVQEEFPIAKWDRFVVAIGDLEDFFDPSELSPTVDQVYDQSSYMGVVKVGRYWEGFENKLAEFFQQMSSSRDWLGYVDLEDRDNPRIEDFRKLFKNDEK